jgi:hypothetical protein
MPIFCMNLGALLPPHTPEPVKSIVDRTISVTIAPAASYDAIARTILDNCPTTIHYGLA